MLPNDLTSELLEFRRERDWEQFHTPRNLSAAICTEAAELLEHFRWAKDTDLSSIVEKDRDSIAQEVADVAILLTYLCHDLGLSMSDAVRQKLIMNRAKYPVEKSKGISTKYDRL